MMDDEQLRSVLREWNAPEPDAAMDQRIHSAWRESHPGTWKRIWSARISVPVPILAALLLIAMVLWFKLGPSRSATVAPAETGGYVTQLNATGFQPAPNGEARIVTVKETQ
jgi:hypothetical protein